jgi:5-enolpyruvylshikimate-3-phosphate synthase
VAAAIAPGSDVILEGVMLNPLRAGLIDTLVDMGAAIERLDVRNEGGEEVADLRVRGGALRRGPIVALARGLHHLEDRGHDVGVGAAATDVAAHQLANFIRCAPKEEALEGKWKQPKSR